MKIETQRQRLTFLVAITVVAVIAVIIFIFLSRQSATAGRSLSYSDVPSGRLADGGFYLGNPDAPITLVEFADFLCPHCQAYEPTMERFIREFVLTGMARFEYRMLPTQNLSPYVGQVAECAAEMYEGGFWPVHDELFRVASSSRVTDDIGRRIANTFNLDYGQLLACTRNANQVVVDQQLANRVGASGTPAIRVRYGDSEPQAISQSYVRGSVPFDVLQATVLAAQIRQQN